MSELLEVALEPTPVTPRGIASPLLIEQVRNTVPFIFQPSWKSPETRFLRLLQSFTNPAPEPFAYFELCLAAHHATVASFVPTDVDSQIRFKLWSPALPTETLVRMSELVHESLAWDYRLVSVRWIASPLSGERLSGHTGEWFSTAAASYGALRKRAATQAAEVAGWILRELDREARIYGDLKKARDGIGVLKAATIIAHNLGDLDRVMDLWNLPPDDPLREAAYQCGHENPSRFRGALHEAGQLNKHAMADENHRHFALRAPRCLRRDADYLLPVGPFFDDWGRKLARHPGLRPEEIGEITDALVSGWERLQKEDRKGPVGYARALAGILEAFPGGFKELSTLLPARVSRALKSGPVRNLCSVSQNRFEEQWSRSALNFLNRAH